MLLTICIEIRLIQSPTSHHHAIDYPNGLFPPDFPSTNFQPCKTLFSLFFFLPFCWGTKSSKEGKISFWLPKMATRLFLLKQTSNMWCEMTHSFVHRTCMAKTNWHSLSPIPHIQIKRGTLPANFVHITYLCTCCSCTQLTKKKQKTPQSDQSKLFSRIVGAHEARVCNSNHLQTLQCCSGSLAQLPGKSLRFIP